jgi:hypothetical protein
MFLIKDLQCGDCRYGFDRYDCILGTPNNPREHYECYCEDYDSDKSCESCGYEEPCRCCSICRDTTAHILEDDARKEMNYLGATIVDSCSKCKRELYFIFHRQYDNGGYSEEKDTSVANLHKRAEKSLAWYSKWVKMTTEEKVQCLRINEEESK